MEDILCNDKRSCFIMSKINPASAIPPAYAPQTKSTNANTASSFKEKPAYIVEIESLYQRENLSRDAKTQVSLTKDTSEDALELFRQKYLEHVDELSASATDPDSFIIPERIVMGLVDGDYSNILEFKSTRQMVDRGCYPPDQADEIMKEWDKYYHIEENIAKGGKKAMLEYNLMFAGSTTYANEKLTDMYANKFIKEGIYTQEQYDKVRNFASYLQNESGVFVSPDFQSDHANGTKIKYSYMGTLCSIGVQSLEVMADHREADEIWVQLAQGAYKNNNEMLQALRDHGYSDVADAYINKIVEISDHRATAKYLTQVPFNTDFKKENGALWDVTIGYQSDGMLNCQAFKDLQMKYFNSDDVNITYTSEQLKTAYEAGKKEEASLNKTFACDLKDDESSIERKKKQIAALKKQIAALNKEIQEIRDTKLPEEKKTDSVNKLEKQKQPIQSRINDILNSIMDELMKNAQ